MSDENILDKILDNTEKVKEVVVAKEQKEQEAKDEKKKKRAEQLKDAQSKFVQIKASVKPELKEKIVTKAQDGNVSGYILKLIENDISKTPSLFGGDDPEIIELKKENEELRSELEKFKAMNFAQKLKWLFS